MSRNAGRPRALSVHHEIQGPGKTAPNEGRREREVGSKKQTVNTVGIKILNF